VRCGTYHIPGKIRLPNQDQTDGNFLDFSTTEEREFYYRTNDLALHIYCILTLINSMSSFNEKFYRAAWGGELVDVKRLVQYGTDVNFKHRDGSTALQGASVRGNTEVVRFLVENGADVHCKDNLGNTALHFASMDGHTEVVSFLIENGADIHCQDDIVGWTALHYACQFGALDAAFILFLKGADLSVKDNTGDSPLDVAVSLFSKPDIEAFSSSSKKLPVEERVIAKAA
jgi:ankyrin repeat protein